MTHIRATTKIVIVNEKDEILLLKIGVHTQRPERSNTNDLPGGFVDDGESERYGAIREIKEETGIELAENDLELVWAETDHYEEGDASFTHLFYFVKLDYTPDVILSWEHESFIWANADKVKAKFDEDNRPRFKLVIEYLQKVHLL